LGIDTNPLPFFFGFAAPQKLAAIFLPSWFFLNEKKGRAPLFFFPPPCRGGYQDLPPFFTPPLHSRSFTCFDFPLFSPFSLKGPEAKFMALSPPPPPLFPASPRTPPGGQNLSFSLFEMLEKIFLNWGFTPLFLFFPPFLRGFEVRNCSLFSFFSNRAQNATLPSPACCQKKNERLLFPPFFFFFP